MIDIVPADESMINIDVNTVFVTVVTDAVLFCPASVSIPLLHAIWVFVPGLRQPPGFDFLVLLAGIAVLGNRDESRFNDLTTTGLETLGAQVCLKHLNEFLDNSRLAQSLSEEEDCGGIWNAVHQAKPAKLIKRPSVINL